MFFDAWLARSRLSRSLSEPVPIGLVLKTCLTMTVWRRSGCQHPMPVTTLRHRHDRRLRVPTSGTQPLDVRGLSRFLPLLWSESAIAILAQDRPQQKPSLRAAWLSSDSFFIQQGERGQHEESFGKHRSTTN